VNGTGWRLNAVIAANVCAGRKEHAGVVENTVFDCPGDGFDLWLVSPGTMMFKSSQKVQTFQCRRKDDDAAWTCRDVGMNYAEFVVGAHYERKVWWSRTNSVTAK
jgi:hypothetical protein